MFDGFVRLCAATPALEVANVEKNAAEIARLALEAAAQGANVCVFPELCLTGYTCGDLFLHGRLVRGALEGLKAVLDATREVDMLMIVGLPVADGNCLYNCAAVLQNGHVLGVVPKTHLPNYAEFYELRQFAPAFAGQCCLRWFGEEVPFSADLLFACRELPEFVIGVEILRRPLGAPAHRRQARPRRGDGAGQPLGQRRHRRQARLPARTGVLPVRASGGGLCLRRGRAG